MKTVKVTRGQYQVLQKLDRSDIGILRKYPEILAASRQLLRTCKKVIRKIEDLPEHANRKKRATAYRKIVSLCQKAIDSVEK